MAFKILRKNCCGLDVHKAWIFACTGITDVNERIEYKEARFSSFSNGLSDWADWLAKYDCSAFRAFSARGYCYTLLGYRLF